MECPSVRDRLSDLVRGRTAPEEEPELRRHLEGCGACRHEEAAERLLDEALGRQSARIAAPAALRAAAAREVERGRAGGEPAARRAPRRSIWIVASAAAAVALAVLGYAAGRSLDEQAVAGARLTDELVTDHLRMLATAHPHEVESSSSHEVKPWFEGRLDFAPIVPGDRGELRLLGGALGYVLDRKAAVVSYGVRRHRVTLLVFPRAGLPGFERVPAAGAPLAVARRGFTVALWAAGDLGYALVADVGPDELQRLADELAPETRRGPRPG
jgi:anti-sigma factor RsiW